MPVFDMDETRVPMAHRILKNITKTNIQVLFVIEHVHFTDVCDNCSVLDLIFVPCGMQNL